MSLTATTIEKPGNTNISRQVLRGALLGFVLAPTLLVWAAIGSSLFGYRVADAWGTSMEPTLHNRDALWVKQLDIDAVKVGNIIAVVPPVDESVTHRVVKIEPMSKGSYLVTTKGDANLFTEDWQISNDWTVAIVAARVPFGGYVLDFCASVIGRMLLAGLVAAMVVIWVRRRRMAHGSGRSTGDA